MQILYLFLFIFFNIPFEILAENKTITHGIAMHGDLKYGKNFSHFDYVNPQAPKGGTVRLGARGTYDSFNGFIIKGNAAAGLGLIYDNLMHGASDEAFSQYGQLAHTIEVPKDRSWISFTLQKNARWHDGKPTTADSATLGWATKALSTSAVPIR